MQRLYPRPNEACSFCGSRNEAGVPWFPTNWSLSGKLREPDRKYSFAGTPIGPFNPNATLLGADIPYDPTNGTVSRGNILRTQKQVE